MSKSFIVTPADFIDPDDKTHSEVIVESAIEDRYKGLFEKCDEHFEVRKLKYDDGIIRYVDDNGNLLFWGVQECKRNKTCKTPLQARVVQALAYVHDRIEKFPHLKETAKLLVLPNEEEIVVIYLEEFLESYNWEMFKLAYEDFKDRGGSASGLYRGSKAVRAEVSGLRLKGIHRSVSDNFDFREVIKDILKNCL